MAAADAPQIEVANKGLLTAAVMTAMVMQILDTTIANVALPHMRASLGATQDNINWVLTSYILASAITIPATGWLADRIGARNLLLLSVALFMGASALCGLATSLAEMVLFRTFQGIAGAFIGPLVQTVMLDINRPSRHPRAMSVYGMGVMIGPIAGPVLGGWLTEDFDWRWVFFVNVPIGAACLAALWFLLPRVPTRKRPFDLTGWLLIALALGALQLLLDRGETIDWFDAAEAWIYLGVMISAGWAFAVHIATSKQPLFPLPMLRNRNLVTGAGFMIVVGMTALAVMALLPPMLQTVFGYPVIDTGLLLAARGFGVLLTMFVAGRIVGKVDTRLIVATGFLITAGSLWMMTGWTIQMDWKPFVISGFIQGLGLGFIFVPLNVISFATLEPQYRTDGAGLFNLARNIGSSIGIAIVSMLFARNLQVSHAHLVEHVTPYNLPVDPSQLSAYGRVGEAGMAMLDNMVNQQAAMLSYLDDFRFMMIVVLAAMPLLLLLKKPAHKGPGEEPLPAMVE
jgi:DHA2 family multidrug resistance protein